MKVALIGATGFVGTALVNELISRGHEVSAISRDPNKLSIENEKLTPVKADAMNVDELSGVLKGHDLVLSAYNAGWTNPNIYDDFLKGSKAIQEAVKRSGVQRYLVIGGAGSLYHGEQQFVDLPGFPKEYYVAASAARDYLTIIKEEQDLDWTFFSPALEMHQGTSGVRTGKYRFGNESPVFGADGRSVLSVEDLAVAVVDEVEQHRFGRKRFTAGY